MPSFDIVRTSESSSTFRAASIKGKYDLQQDKITERFTGNIDLPDSWKIGCIVGNSGTGKTTIARELFPDNYINGYKYTGKSVIDDFPKSLSVDVITETLNNVGFSSPPSWLKPYAVLSQGEQMRVDIARALLSDKDLIVYDEYTSVVNREVAKVSSLAISKSIRRSHKRFIAVTCHFDILEWLQPDWIFDTNSMKLTVGDCLQRPQINISIYREKGKWNLFRRYHYLNSELNNSSVEYVAYKDDTPVAYCAILHFPHASSDKIKRVHRLVVLPDYQGIGIGKKLLDYTANIYKKDGYRFTIVTSNPALLISLNKDNHWKLNHSGHVIPPGRTSGIKNFKKTISANRLTTSWQYV